MTASNASVMTHDRPTNSTTEKDNATCRLMPEMSSTIRFATPQDAVVLAELGARTFYATFARDNKPEDIDSYVARAFNPEQMALELRDPRSTFLLAELNDQAVGYTKLRIGATPICVDGPRPIELERIYVDQRVVGRGLGAALMRACLEKARQAQHGVIWLGVWERNDHARTFYHKWGFRDVGTKTFTVGEDVQNDVVMMRSTGAPV